MNWRVVLLSFVSVTAFSQDVATASSEDWQAACRNVIDRLEYRQAIANPIHVRLAHRRETQAVPSMNRKAGVFVRDATIARKGSLWRFEHITEKTTEIYVYDGTKLVIDRAVLTSVNGEKRRELAISLDPSRVRPTPSPFDASGENHWLATMRDALSRPDDVDGECRNEAGILELRLSVPAKDGSIWTSRAWLDTNHDCIPRRIELDSNSDGASEVVRTIERTEDFAGLRLPSLVRSVTRHIDGTLIKEDVYELESCSLDPNDVPDVLFEPDLSGNIVVQDLDHGIVLTDRAEIDEYLARISARSWTRKTFWVAIVNVVIVAIVIWRCCVARQKR